MSRSMTGYGRAEVTCQGLKFSCEVHSVNRRNLEIAASFPKEFSFLEPIIKKKVGKLCSRGQVHMRLVCEEMAKDRFSTKALSSLEKELSKTAKDLGDYELTFDTLIQVAMRESSMPTQVDRDESERIISQGFDQAIEAWLRAKTEEGKALITDIDERLDEIKEELKAIETMPNETVASYEQRLTARIEEFSSLQKEDRERVQKEIVLFADKIDVTEEIVRLVSHVDQFKALLQSKQESKGKEMEFLLQEMMREMTTFTSKSVDLTITYKGLNIKSDLEKIRQQVLNIE